MKQRTIIKYVVLIKLSFKCVITGGELREHVSQRPKLVKAVRESGLSSQVKDDVIH